jgi:hypothetical protein
VDIVLGVSMAPTTVRMVLVEGENADGATVDEDGFDVPADDESAIPGAPERVIAAILGTRESAAEGDYHLAATGVTWTDPAEAAALRDALVARKVENVMLVSAFLAAAALAQSVGSAVGYAHTGLLFLEPDAATLAIVDSTDGSITDVLRQPVQSTESLTDLMAQLEVLESRPDGVFVVGAGVDITAVKSQLEAATALPVTVPEEPDMALARGAALASANAPLFASSTAAVAYSQVPDRTTAGVVESYAADAGAGNALAYAAESEDDAYTAVDAGFGAEDQGRKSFLVALSVMTVFFVGVMALVVALGIRARPAMSQQPRAAGNLIFPVKEAPAPAPKAEVQAPPAAPPNVVQRPAPEAPPPANAVAPASAPEAPAPEAAAPAPEAAAPAPVPAAPKPVPVAMTPAPVAAPPPAAPVVPAPAAPAPAPVAPAPAAPAPAPVPVAPVPIPVPVAPVIPILPPVFNPPVQSPPFQPGGGDRNGVGWPPGVGGRDRGGWPPAGGGRDNGAWPPGGGWQPGGGVRGGGGWLPGGAPGGGGIGGNHGGFGDGPGGFGGGHAGGIGGGFGGGHGGFGGGHGGFGGVHGGR